VDYSTVLGLVVGAACLAAGAFWGGNAPSGIWDAPAALLVLGGTLAATMVAYPFSVIKTIPRLVALAFRRQTFELGHDVEQLVALSDAARRGGLLSLESSVTGSDPFLRKGVMLIVDGSDPRMVRAVMETELHALALRHQVGAEVLRTMGGLAPAFGLVGTVMGLMRLLSGLDRLEALGPAMASALMSTLYGCVLAYLVLLPMAKKLRHISGMEYRRKELVLEGLLAIQDGENPRLIRDRLNAFLARSQVKAPSAGG